MRGRFLVTFVGVLFLLLAYLAWRTVVPLRESIALVSFVGAIFAVGSAAILWMPLFFWTSNDSTVSPFETFAERTAHLAMGFFSLLFMLVVAHEIAALAIRTFGGTLPWTARDAAIGLLLGAAGLFGLGVWIAFAGPRLMKVDLRRPDSPEPIRILQISDLHVGTWIGRDYVERLAREIETTWGALDLIVLTGDIGDGDVRLHRESLEPLRRLKARLGKFAVTGNHEGYWDAEGWNEALRGLGFRILENEGAVLESESRRMTIHGIDDARPDLARALANRRPGAPSILLAHQPHHATAAAEAGVSLVLAGHTHAGQFLPWSLLIGRFHDFAHGLYRTGSTAVYVNAGTGFWGPPLRLGTRSEVTLIEL